jgi:hypothetical protein
MPTPNIATNPDTGVRYYADPGPQGGHSVDLFVPLRNGEVTNPSGAPWPNLFGLPEDRPELVWYLKTAPQVREYDDRTHYEIATWGPVPYASPKPGGPLGTWEETLEVKPHPQDKLIGQVEAAYSQANSRLYPPNGDPLFRELLDEAEERDKVNQATPAMQELLALRQRIRDAGQANWERQLFLIEEIKAGRPVDLSACWVNEVS